jgi:hypothetical protein
MNDNDDTRAQVGGGYPLTQLARAFVTAVTHEDAETRRRAEDRARHWQSVLAGMANRTLSIGSRTPVQGLPAWATPQVVRGGFATGAAAAGGPLRPHEAEVARRAGLPADRRAVFTYHLTEPGLAELGAMLDSGRYHVEVAEEAALLVVAWLLRAGDRLGALRLLDTLEPFADLLRFVPAPSDAPASDPAIVWRETVADVRRAIDRRRPNERVEAMREALAVWNPFGDELLALWLESAHDGQVASRMPTDWTDRGAALLERYRALAATHTRCAKHRQPKENLAILRAALQDVVAGRSLNPRRRGLLQHAVDSMVRRRGRPGSDQHTRLRERQSKDASLPTHHALAKVVAARLSVLPHATGVRSTEPPTQPVRPEEARTTGIPVGSAIPPSIRRVVGRALAGPIETLIERGVVPSAEVLAELVPQIAASTTAMVYPDEALRALMATIYEAFRRRRSLLLLNLEHQVQLDELPWVAAVDTHRSSGADAERDARAALVRLSELALEAFPATILPNPLIRELDALAKGAGLQLPLVEELAADIFMGSFSAKFLQAAKVAGHLLRGSLYERYYGIDYQAILAIDDTRRRRWLTARTSDAFDALCQARAGRPRGGYSVAANGMVIEQAQILTTHNLATLVSLVGVTPGAGWPDLARRAFHATCRLVARLRRNPRPLVTVKDAAYAWRHLLFFISMSSPDQQAVLLDWVREEARSQPAHVVTPLASAVAGLAHVGAGGTFDPDGTAGDARRFLGWVIDGHWMRPRPASAERSPTG